MKWNKASEIVQDGFYILHRTDDNSPLDEPFNNKIIEIKRMFFFDRAVGLQYNIKDFDSECRFFGPIPGIK